MMNITEPSLEAYAEAHTEPLPPLLLELIEETKRQFGKRATMLSGQLEGSLLQALVAVGRARRVLEIGMFAGFSAQMMAAALPDDGRLITCDIDPKAIALAKQYFARSPHGHKIEVREGPALETIKTLDGPFDLVFIDADKGNYTSYYEAVLPLLAPDGVIAVDNVLWSGRVLDPTEQDDRAIVAFNKHVQADERVVAVMVPIRDGLTLIRRK